MSYSHLMIVGNLDSGFQAGLIVRLFKIKKTQISGFFSKLLNSYLQKTPVIIICSTDAGIAASLW